MNAKMLAPKRGEIGLAKFHHLIGYASFFAGLALMLASFTALYWFGGVIGLPTVARVAVAVAFEVLAAGLASSATTAKRETGKTDLSAWFGFACVISINAYSNVMHVIVSLNNPKPGSPAADLGREFYENREFVIAACVFAAACAFGGTLGVHRFGWLRAHGADAEWTDTEGGVVVDQPPKPASKPKRAPQVEQPAARAPESAPAPRVEAPRPAAAAAGDPKDLVRAMFDEMVAADPYTKPDAAEIRRRALGLDDPKAAPVRQTVGNWVLAHWREFEAERANQSAAPGAPISARDEVRIADPAEDEMDDHRARHAANVA